MPSILLDQNIPFEAGLWLSRALPGWNVQHVNSLGFQGKPDAFLYQWAQARQSVIVTYDGHFADAHLYALGPHNG